MENNFSIDGARRWIPIRGLSQVTDFLQIVHAVKMREDLFGMSKKVREDVINVSGALQDVAEDHVNINGKGCGFETVATEAGESLLLQQL